MTVHKYAMYINLVLVTCSTMYYCTERFRFRETADATVAEAEQRENMCASGGSVRRGDARDAI